MNEKPSDKIKWRSRTFPKLVLTESHYELMRRIYPHIDSFRREMERLEGWLYANPQRLPRKNWKNQVNNWMRKADEIAAEREVKGAARGETRPMTHRESAERLGDVLKRMQEEKP